MKKILIAAFLTGLMTTACVFVDDSCECVYEDPPTCLNSIDLGASCMNDCDWDVVDCDEDCYYDGYAGGHCEEGAFEDYCVCYY